MKINYPSPSPITFGDIAIGELFICEDTLYAKAPDALDERGRFLGNALVIGDTPVGSCTAGYEQFTSTEEVTPIAEITLKV